jgi:hypothetical protein
MIGGEGAGLLGRFIIGGGGFGQNVARQTTDSFRANLSYGAGYFKFGYILIYTDNNFGYVYGGIGGGGLNVRLENLSDEAQMRFNHRAPLKPGFKADYTLPTTFYDLGFSYKRMFMSARASGGEGGFMLGLDLGCSIAVPTDGWQGTKDEVVSGPTNPGAFLNPYLRLTIGGGGFGLK